MSAPHDEHDQRDGEENQDHGLDHSAALSLPAALRSADLSAASASVSTVSVIVGSSVGGWS